MTAPRRFPLAELANEQQLVILGWADWLDRARKGEIKRPLEAIERNQTRSDCAEAILKILQFIAPREAEFRIWCAEQVKRKT